MNVYVIYKFEDQEIVENTIKEIENENLEDIVFFKFDIKDRNRKFWHKYAIQKLKDSHLVIVFGSLQDDKKSFGKNVLWELKKAEKLRKRIIVFQMYPDSNNHTLFEVDYSDKEPGYPRYKTVSQKNIKDFMVEEYGWKIANNILHQNDGNKTISNDEKQLLLEQYRIMIETSEKLMERRQETVGLYTTLCTAILALIGASFAFENVFVSAFVLFMSGVMLFILCRNWRLSLNAFELNNTGKFKVINYLEKQLPAEIFECEYRYNKLNGIQSFSSREKILPKIFSVAGILIIVTSVVMLTVALLRKFNFI